MDDLSRALSDISSIRKQVANSTEFRGYGPATLATTGVFAALAAVVQQLWLADAGSHIAGYLSIWVFTAALSAALAGFQMYTRARRIHSALSDEMIHMAVEQSLPSIVAGLLLTVVLVGSAPHSAWMLPGVWQILFSLGIFSSCRFLPKPMFAAGVWYLLTGLICISIGNAQALSPLAMAIPFGAGQMLIAAVLRFSSSKVEDEI
jgi:hypothetical protein